MKALKRAPATFVNIDFLFSTPKSIFPIGPHSQSAIDLFHSTTHRLPQTPPCTLTMSSAVYSSAFALTSGLRTKSSSRSAPRRAVSVRAKGKVSGDNNAAEGSDLSRRAVLGGAVALVGTLVGTPQAFASDADFVRDTKEIITMQRGLLREGKGDVNAYMAKADAYFAGYKWDHQGHTNSFSALMSNDIVIREQNNYLVSTEGSWSAESVPATGTPKAKILEGYLQNAERCVVKEGYGKFNSLSMDQRAEWKAITCTQGLVAPAD